jgi:hypothetical protein
MIWSTPALKTTTIYEDYPYNNTGLDQIIELRKSGDSTTGDLAESRILLEFDLSTLSNILAENNVSLNTITASLKLYSVQELEVPKSYTIEARALANSWENGSGGPVTYGAESTNTSIVDGATWLTVAGLGTTTWSSSYTQSPSGKNIQYNITSSVGGGVWYTASIASQSFNYKTTDTFSVDVTNIVKRWQTGSLPNYGFLVAFRNSEIVANNYPETNLQFYSSNTHTVYEPQLYISWPGSQTYITGSQSVITYEEEPIVYLRASNRVFRKNSKVRMLLGARPRYPRPAFTQNSVFATTRALTSASYYQIKDAHSNEIVIPYSEATKINTNASGSYFDFYTTMMYPERYYTFGFKSVLSDANIIFESNDYTFKIVLD